MMIGASGRTHGLNIVINPATKLRISEGIIERY
jgi:hypothetical protein